MGLETEAFIANGDRSAFFRLRQDRSKGVKIRFDSEGNNAKDLLKVELRYAQILMKLGISVPRYYDVVEVVIPEHIEQTLDKKKSSHEHFNDMKKFMIEHKGMTLWGLIMDYIDGDVVKTYHHLSYKEYENAKKDPVVRQKLIKDSLISPQRLDIIFMKELYKVWDYGIDTRDSTSSGMNVLYTLSYGAPKIYLIDFETWDFSNMKEPEKETTQNASVWSRLRSVFG